MDLGKDTMLQTSFATKQRWVPNYYPAAELTYLPQRLELGQDSYALDYLQNSEIHELHALICSAAGRKGSNVAKDEYTDRNELDELLNISQVFVLCRDSRDTEQTVNTKKIVPGIAVLNNVSNCQASPIVASIIIQPWLNRSHCPRLCQIYIIVAPETFENKNSAGVYSTLTQLAERFVIDLDLCYEACIMCVSIECVSLVKQLRENGYMTALTVQFAFQNEAEVHEPSQVMYKYLQPSKKQVPMQEIIAYADSTCKGPTHDHLLNFPAHPSVPLRYTFRNGGPTVLLRAMRADEADYVFRLFELSAEAGIGYGYEECPTVQYYKEHILTNTCTVILEMMDSEVQDTDGAVTKVSSGGSVPNTRVRGDTGSVSIPTAAGLTSKRIAIIQTSPSCLNRGKSMPLADLDIVFDPSFKGNGMGLELQALAMALAKEAGYKAVMSDVFEENKPVVKTSIKNKFALVGVLPKTVFLNGKGWTDSLFCYRDCDDILTFEQMKEANAKANVGLTTRTSKL